MYSTEILRECSRQDASGVKHPHWCWRTFRDLEAPQRASKGKHARIPRTQTTKHAPVPWPRRTACEGVVITSIVVREAHLPSRGCTRQTIARVAFHRLLFVRTSTVRPPTHTPGGDILFCRVPSCVHRPVRRPTCKKRLPPFRVDSPSGIIHLFSRQGITHSLCINTLQHDGA